MNITLLDKTDLNWGATIINLYEKLGFPNNPHLLPPQFAQVTVPKIGGKLVILQAENEVIGAGFLLPRAYDRLPQNSPESDSKELHSKSTHIKSTYSGKRTYTLRYHPVIERAIDPKTLVPLIESELEHALIIPFDANAPKTYPTKIDSPETGSSTTIDENSIIITPPNATEAETIRQIHQQIWRSAPGYLYPSEMHCVEYGPGTSLIARASTKNDATVIASPNKKLDVTPTQVAGFLIGFYRFAGSKLPADWHERLNGEWRLESQSMGILAEFRKQRLGYRLKLAQAAQARHEQIQIIHWTFDPLQFRNAALNIGLLRGIAFDFHADLYPFRNELNQVAASRFSVTWLVNAQRVQQSKGQQAKIFDLKNDTQIVRLNNGPKRTIAETDAPQIAIEIPADWSTIQSKMLTLAQEWRSATDEIFAQFIGCKPGQYVVTDVAVDGPRCYLIAKQVSDQLWHQLSVST